MLGILALGVLLITYVPWLTLGLLGWLGRLEVPLPELERPPKESAKIDSGQMTQRPERIVILALLIAGTPACGKSGEAQAVAEASGAAAAQAPGAAASKQAAGGRGGAANRTDPPLHPSARAVSFESLKELLPEVDGWTKSDATGEQLTSPVTYSRAQAVYRRDDSRIELEITDSALSQMLLAPTSVFLGPGYSERSDDGFKRAIKLGGQPAVEQWHTGSRRAEVTAVVGGRYLVRASGDDVPSPDTVRAVVESVNLSRLAALR